MKKGLKVVDIDLKALESVNEEYGRTFYGESTEKYKDEDSQVVEVDLDLLEDINEEYGQTF